MTRRGTKALVSTCFDPATIAAELTFRLKK